MDFNGFSSSLDLVCFYLEFSECAHKKIRLIIRKNMYIERDKNHARRRGFKNYHFLRNDIDLKSVLKFDTLL